MCLNDKCDAIRELASLFFIKLSERSNNPVYNLLGDIIAVLSRSQQNPSTDTASSSSSTLSESLVLQSQNDPNFVMTEVKKEETDEVIEGESLLAPPTTNNTSTAPLPSLLPKEIILNRSSVLSHTSYSHHTQSTTGDGEGDIGGLDPDNELPVQVVAVAAVDIDEDIAPLRILESREFQNTMKFLLEFVKKDK